MLKELYELLDILNPIVIITDAEKGLIAGILLVFALPETNHLLCVWHINKNIVVHCKNCFQTDEAWQEFHATWQTVLYADTEEKFEELWSFMQLKYDGDIVSMDYLEHEVICPHKTKIIRCFTNRVRHFGNTAMSKSENQNARLKAELQTSTGMQQCII